ncbi:MAG TPA: WG repeat-containing protein, partial [Bacteroidia bacterium]
MAQTVIVLDSCLAYRYEIHNAGVTNQYYIKEIRLNHVNKIAKFTFIKQAKSNKAKKDNNSLKADLKSHFPRLNGHQFKSADSVFIQLYKNHSISMIDTITYFNLIGEVSRITVLEDELEIEEILYNCKQIEYHFRTKKGLQFDTSFDRDGYKATTRDKKGKILQMSRYRNGQFEFIKLDPKKTFSFAPYINLNTGIFCDEEEYYSEQNIQQIQKIGNNRYLVSGGYFSEGELNNKENAIIEKKTIFNHKGKHFLHRDSRYRYIEKQQFDEKNELIAWKRYNKKGELTEFYKKRHLTHYNNYPYHKTQDIHLYIQTSKNRLSYKSNRFKGTFTLFKNYWAGADTFYSGTNIYITEIKIYDQYYLFETFLNGQYLSNGKIDYEFDRFNLFEYEDEEEFEGNNFLEHINYKFHNDNFIYSDYDSLKIGKDSTLKQIHKDRTSELIFSTFDKETTVVKEKNISLTLFKDQSLCAMGARNDSGQIIIPAKFDDIVIIYLFNNIKGYLCFINDVATILSSEGKTIIQYRKGLNQMKWMVSENFRRQNKMLLPFLFVCNDYKNDSFALVSITDEVVFTGKGRLSLLDNQCALIERPKYKLLMNRDGLLYNDSFVAIKKLDDDVYALTIIDKIVPDNKWQLDKKSGRADFPKKTYHYKYKIIDLKKDPSESIIYDDMIDINASLTLFKKPGQTLIKYAYSGQYTDTSNLYVRTRQNENFVELIHYNKIGLLMPTLVKIIPPKYEQISINNSTIVARRGSDIDVYDPKMELKFSLNYENKIKDSKLAIHRYYDQDIYVHSYNDEPILYRININNLCGLFDKKGKVILEPEYDNIQFEQANQTYELNFYETLVTSYDIVIKTIKGKKAEMFIFVDGQLKKIQPKLMWSVKQANNLNKLVYPNGSVYEGNDYFQINHFNFAVNLYDSKNALKAKLDLYGNEIYNTSNFTQVKQINKVTYVQLKNGKCGTLNCQNEFEIQPIYSELYLNKDNQLLWYKYGYNNELWKLKLLKQNIDANDSFDFPIEIGEISKQFVYSKHRKLGVMDLKGNVLVSAIYDQFVRGEKDQSYLFSLNETYYSWSQGMKLPVLQNYKNLFYTRNNDYNSSNRHSTNAYSGYEMFIVSSDFNAVDSSKDMFFGRSFHSREKYSTQYSRSPFIIQQKNNLEFINSLIQTTSNIHWSGLYPAACFPQTYSSNTISTQPVLKHSSVINLHIKFSDYSKLDYTHLKDKNMWVMNNGVNTISFKDYYQTSYLNIYIDSLLGYMVFNLSDLFKGASADSLTRDIRNKWLALDDPNLPCMAKDKIFEHFMNRFTIDG